MSDGHGRRFNLGLGKQFGKLKKYNPFSSKSKSKSEREEESEERENRRAGLSRSYSQHQGDQFGNRSSNFSSSDLPRSSTSTQRDGARLRRSSTSTQHRDRGDGAPPPISFPQRRGRRAADLDRPADHGYNSDVWPQGSSEVHRRKFPKIEPDNDPLGLRQERRMEWQKPLYDLPYLPDPSDDPLGVWKETSPGTYEIPLPKTTDGYLPAIVDDAEATEWVKKCYHLQKNHPELIKNQAQFGPVEDIMYYRPNPSDYPTYGAFFREIHNRLGIELLNARETTSPPPQVHCHICFREGHWHRFCPFRDYLPPDACIDLSFCYIVCKCGQDFSEQGPCPESCREDKFVRDYHLKELVRRTLL